MSFPTFTPTAEAPIVPWWFYPVLVFLIVFFIKAMIEIIGELLK